MPKSATVLRGLSLFGSALWLSGCVAVAAPLIPLFTAASVGMTGFFVHKTVQSETGGKIGVAFPSVDDKESPPPPLPNGRSVAVWPGDRAEVYFSEKLEKSERFSVTPPSRVLIVLQDAKITSDLGQLTETEQIKAFSAICRTTKVDLVFAKHSLGSSLDAGLFKFSRSNTTEKINLLGFSCTRKSVIWRDQMAIILDVGSKAPAPDEVSQVAGESWAERVIDSPQPKISGASS